MLAYGTSRVVYIDNKTNKDIENLCITHGGKVTQNHKIKIIKAKPETAPFTRKTIQLMGTITGIDKLKMYYYDKNNIKHEYVIMEKLTNQFFDNIGIEIIDVKEDGELELTIYKHFKG